MILNILSGMVLLIKPLGLNFNLCINIKKKNCKALAYDKCPGTNVFRVVSSLSLWVGFWVLG